MKWNPDLAMVDLSEMTCSMETLSDIGNLEDIKNWATRCWLDLGEPSDKMNEMLLSIEEAFANICFHAYKSEPGPVRLECISDHKNTLTFTIMDWAEEFDVTQIAAPDTAMELSRRNIGGLGVLLIREMADEIDWRRENGFNALSLKFNVTS